MDFWFSISFVFFSTFSFSGDIRRLIKNKSLLTDKLVEFGINPYRSLTIAPDCSHLLAELLRIFEHETPLGDLDAAFTPTYTLTLTVLSELKRLKVRLPVIGFCNIELSDIFYCQPVIIVHSSDELGRLASEPFALCSLSDSCFTPTKRRFSSFLDNKYWAALCPPNTLSEETCMVAIRRSMRF